MKDIPVEELVPALLEDKRMGKSNSELREKLRNQGYDPNDIRIVLRHVDSEYLDELSTSKRSNKKNLFQIFSLGVITAGLAIDIVLWLRGARAGYLVGASGISLLGLILVWRQFRLFKKLNSD